MNELQQAFQLQQQGKLDEARAGYLRVLAVDARNFDALHLLGMIDAQQGRLAEAVERIRAALLSRPQDVPALANLGAILDGLGRREEALTAYDRALAAKPDIPEVLTNRGNTLAALGRIGEALASYDRAIALRPDYAQAHYGRSNRLLALGRAEEAVAGYDRALASLPQLAPAMNNRAAALLQLGRAAEALASCDQALALQPDNADALSNRGNALLKLKRPDDALASFDRAAALRPDFVAVWSNRASALHDLDRPAEALASCDRALALDPRYADALANRGVALAALRRNAEALASYDQALALNPADADAWFNRGVTLFSLHRSKEALASFDKALAIRPAFASALLNRGHALFTLKQLDEALASYEGVLAIEPHNPFAFNGCADAALNACDWWKTNLMADELPRRIAEGHDDIQPFMIFGYPCSAETQLMCAQNLVRRTFPARKPIWRSERYRHDRIRIAYLSADFRQHPLAFLMAGVFENHDRGRFDILALSYGADDGSPIRSRIKGAFPRFEDVRERDDAAVARLIRDHEIDIAVDLTGHTRDGRPAILSHRPAPVQVSYLGFLGTMGADFIDYMIADETILPPDQERWFSEKIVRLPNTYWATDRKLAAAERAPSRSEAGLPEAGFVFCCFNNSYKITQPVFDIWMRLLRETEGSVLWLYGDNEAARRNLRAEAEARGVPAARLVFAGREPLDRHLARMQLADLMLDTLPYNAHTTTSDALWVGVPTVTCLGETLQGRVAASLLRAAGLPELVTGSLADYEALIRRLVSDPGLLQGYKRRLAETRLTCPLFDTARFTRNLEAAYVRMWEQAERGEAPESFSV